MNRLSNAKLACLVFAAALLFRFGMYAAVPPPSYSPDSKNFYEVAESIAAGQGFAAMLHDKITPFSAAEPGYSLFLAFWYILGLGGIHSLVLIQIFLAAFLAPVVYYYVLRRSDRSVALAAALIYAFDPLAAGACFFILREIFVMAVVLATVSALDMSFRKDFLVKGFLMGLAGLSFPVYTLWSIFLWVLARRNAVTGRRVGAAAVVFAWIVAGSWMARNAVLSDGHMLIRRHPTSILLFFTSHYESNGLVDTRTPEFKDLVARADREFGRYAGEEQRDYERRALEATWKKFRAEPARVIWRFIKVNFWFWLEVPGSLGLLDSRPVLHGLLLAYHGIQLLLALAGLAMIRAGLISGDYGFVWGTVLYLAIFVFPFMPIPRYYISVLPLIDILAACGLVGLLRGKAVA
ncbi:hypothetical protein HY522_12065 [bacterium]|nr:hypothetical protein [bacterium]